MTRAESGERDESAARYMTYFAFCIHNHQPVGNFGHVLEDAYARCYLPFIEVLSEHPSIKLTLHNSGFLLDWIAEAHPEYIELVGEMAGRGQVEIMGGGYYEPVLQAIPEADRIGQIRSFSDRIEGLFGVRPRGVWLAERVWEPTLPASLAAAGAEYLLLDDFHFIKAGLEPDELGGSYTTEEQGEGIRVFPGSERLRYLIPFRPIAELLEYIEGLAGSLKKGNAAIYGDDGEKFGLWPGTAEWVYKEGWLEGFFRMMEEASAWLRPVTLSGLLDAEPPLGRVYLPATSYMEMGEWSLPVPAAAEYVALIERLKEAAAGGDTESAGILRFVQGGTWRNFMAKYTEADWMHKRMLSVSRLVSAKAVAGGADEGMLDEARRGLYMAECNDAYWHGIFGGLYLPHLRTAVYENLIRAETLLSDAPSSGEAFVEVSDMDADGFDEVSLRTAGLNLFIAPSRGGALVELDVKSPPVNLSNTLTRRREAYHAMPGRAAESGGAVGEGGQEGAASIHDMPAGLERALERNLVFDSSQRASFVERFFEIKETCKSFLSCEYTELGDFINTSYDVETRPSGVRLSRDGHAGEEALRVTKEFTARAADSFSVDYHVERLRAHNGPSGDGRVLCFGVELNLLLPACSGPACAYVFEPGSERAGLATAGERAGLDGVTLEDTHTGVRVSIESAPAAALWRGPIHTVSYSEQGLEKIYQGSCLLFVYALPGGPDGLRVSFTVTASGF